MAFLLICDLKKNVKGIKIHRQCDNKYPCGSYIVTTVPRGRGGGAPGQSRFFPLQCVVDLKFPKGKST